MSFANSRGIKVASSSLAALNIPWNRRATKMSVNLSSSLPEKYAFSYCT